MAKAKRKPYKEYLDSEHWEIMRERAVKRAGNHCAVCSSRERLSVHHNNYERLGREKASDLVVLCDKCHKLYHNIAPTDDAKDTRDIQKAVDDYFSHVKFIDNVRVGEKAKGGILTLLVTDAVQMHYLLVHKNKHLQSLNRLLHGQIADIRIHVLNQWG